MLLVAHEHQNNSGGWSRPPVSAHAEADELQLASSREHCREVVKAQAKNFYYGMRLTPPDRRDALYAVYAWMRYADDLIDDAPDDTARRAALELLCAQTEDILRLRHTSSLHSPLADTRDATVLSGTHWPALHQALRQFPIQDQWLRSMLRGMRDDTQGRTYHNIPDLLEYCYCVGGTVGLTCTAIWGVRREYDHALRLAEVLGRAFQLTNIARDIGQDLRSGRCYVPDQLLTSVARADLEEMAARRRPVSPAAEWIVQSLTLLATKYYDEARPLEALIRPDCLASLHTMTRIYKGVLARLIADPTLAFTGRARVATPRKLLAVAAGVYRQFEASGL